MTQEILTAEEFAQRLKIGRSTLFDWLSKDILVSGKHYLKVGRVLRFVWCDDVVITLLERSTAATELRQSASKKSKPVAAIKTIDWNY